MSDEYDMPSLHFHPEQAMGDNGNESRSTQDANESLRKKRASIIRYVLIAIAALVVVLISFGVGFSTGFTAGMLAESEDRKTYEAECPANDEPNEMCFTDEELEDVRQGKDCAEAKIYETPANTWITFQRRGAFDQDFFRPFKEYEEGFGNICSGGDFWLGLNHLWNLTSQGAWQMRSSVTEFHSGDVHWIQYENFTIGPAPGYTLGLGGAYAGNIAGEIGDASTVGCRYHRGMKFTTYDKDQDTTREYNCASKISPGGFWYGACFTVGVNQRQPRDDGEAAQGCNFHDKMEYNLCNPTCARTPLRASLLQIRRIE